jgi:hypothetical protein
MSEIKSTRSLLASWKKLLSADWRASAKQRQKLHALMQKMRVKQRAMQQELAQCDDADERKLLESKLALIKEKRRKGLQLLETLRRQRNGDEADG